MKFTHHLTRLVVTVFICGLMMFSNVMTVHAAPDNPTKLIDQLPMPNIQKKAEEITKTSAFDTNPEYTSEKATNQGLNEIQGTADFDKMKRSPNETVPPVITDAAKAFDKVGDKLNSAKDDAQDSVTSNLSKVGDKASNAANFVKGKAGNAVNSITDKAADTAKSIKNKVKH